MKNIASIFTFFILCYTSIAQNNFPQSKLIKVKPIKPSFELDYQKTNTFGVVLGFEIINSIDKNKYGEKIYAVIPSLQYPGNWIFDGEIYDLEITDQEPKYVHQYPLINGDLLKKNIDGKEFWVIEIFHLKEGCINGAASK